MWNGNVQYFGFSIGLILIVQQVAIDRSGLHIWIAASRNVFSCEICSANMHVAI